MKQTTLIKWIEAAEARAVCQLAVSENWAPKVLAIRSDAHTTVATARLPGFLGHVSRRLARFERLRSAA
jgi:hypothetical protein